MANANCDSPATPPNATIVAPSALPESLQDLSVLVGAVLPFSAFINLPDWLKIAILGAVLEFIRRIASRIWDDLKSSLFLTARFDQDDRAYEWMMIWLSKQPAFRAARDIEVSTRSFGTGTRGYLVPGEVPSGSDDNPDNARTLAYVPAPSMTYTLWYKRRWVRVVRTKAESGGLWTRSTEDKLEVQLLTRDRNVLNSLLLDAKRAYLAEQSQSVSVYVSDSCENWRLVASRPKRPLHSIILEPGVAELVLDDARDFLDSKSWYSARGIPFRRGYLLHGAPGSGKTSLIQSVAGALGLDVYIISLSRAGLDDTSLSNVIADLPERCIALMEDIDAAFHAGITRGGDVAGSLSPTADDEAAADGQRTGAPPQNGQVGPAAPPASRVTLSGLLNALDGVGAQEGRILFATTNRYNALDPALCRPGRMDLHIEFQLASRFQAEELFKCFYLPLGPVPVTAGASAGASEGSGIKEEPTEKVTDAEVEIDVVPADDDVDLDLIDLGDSDKASTATCASSRSASPERVGSSPSTPVTPTTPSSPSFAGLSHRARAPALSRQTYMSLARRFARAIPEREFSMASLQGYLMAYKIRPVDAVRDASAWVVRERAEREKKMKEKLAAR